MTDYQPLLARALKGLERNTSEARRAVYDRARQALLNQLRSANPPMADADITRERLALEDAIRKTETEAVLAEPHSVRSPSAARMPGAPSPQPRPHSPAVPHRPAPQPRIPMPPQQNVRVPSQGRMQPPNPGNIPQPRPPMPHPAQPPEPAPEDVTPKDELPFESEAPAPEQEFSVGEPTRAEEFSPEIEPSPAPPPRPRRPRPPFPRGEEAGPDDFPPAGRGPAHIAQRGLGPNHGPNPGEGRAVPPGMGPNMGPNVGPGIGPRPRGPRPPGRGPGPGPGIGAPPKAKPDSGLRTKLLLGGLAVLAVAVAGVFAYTYKFRHAGPAASQSAPSVAEGDQPKTAERIAPSGDGASAPSQPTNLDPSVAQRAVLYEENPGGGQQFQNFVGTAVWKTEAVNAPGRAPDLGLRIEAEIPDRKINVTLKMRRNTDPSFPASHTIEVLFDVPAGDPFGGVADMRGIRAKGGETAQGTPLAAEVQKVKEGYFLLALPQIEEDANLSMLRERDWLDIPFVYANGRRAVLTFQKGTPGERALREVLNSWGKGGASN